MKELLENVNESVNREVTRLLSTGAIDLDKYEDDYRLPKLLLIVSLENIAKKYSPLSEDGQKELQNLRRF